MPVCVKESGEGEQRHEKCVLLTKKEENVDASWLRFLGDGKCWCARILPVGIFLRRDSCDGTQFGARSEPVRAHRAARRFVGIGAGGSNNRSATTWR